MYNKKMKKAVFIIAINFILLLIFLIGAEAYTYKHYKQTFEKNKQTIEKNNQAYEQGGNHYRFKQEYSYPLKFEDTQGIKFFKPPKYGNGNKKPVIFFGCSFTEGAGLTDEQTLAYKISQLTGRTTYNRGKGSTGTQFMYYQLSTPELKYEVPEAEYIIYTFIWDHLFRLYNYQACPLVTGLNLRYKVVNGKLEEIKPAFVPFYSLYLVKKFQVDIADKKAIEEEQNFKLFNFIMKESIKLAQKTYPQSKFVIIEYPDSHTQTLPPDEVIKLKDMGFVVVNAEEMLGHNLQDSKYRLVDNHPSKLAWEEIAPKLARKLNL